MLQVQRTIVLVNWFEFAVRVVFFYLYPCFPFKPKEKKALKLNKLVTHNMFSANTVMLLLLLIAASNIFSQVTAKRNGELCRRTYLA